MSVLKARSRSALLSSTAFAKTDFRPRWLVEGLLVADQPIVLGGGIKTLKTSLALDLAISLGSGTPFLETFPVPKAATVLFMSGENAHGVVQETAQRICRAKGCGLAATKTKWSFRLPDLGSDIGLQRLSQTLSDAGAQAVIIDPLYACLSAGGGKGAAGNLYDIGSLLKDAASACLEAGATPVMVHPASKQASKFDHKSSDPVVPLDVRDLAFAGMAEFARQWILLNRRSGYRLGSGRHELLMSAGGSAGHSGCWEIDVDEGTLKTDFTGRRWNVSVHQASDEESPPSARDARASRLSTSRTSGRKAVRM